MSRTLTVFVPWGALTSRAGGRARPEILMFALSPSLLIATAVSHLGATQSADNYRPDAELFRHAPLAAGEEAWSLHFVQHVGAHSHLDHESRVSTWPLPSTRLITELARSAAEDGVLRDDLPKTGDVFLLWSPAKHRYVRAGIIVAVIADYTGADGKPRYRCLTIEAIGAETGHRFNRTVLRRERNLMPGSGDRVIRWTELRPGHLHIEEAA